MKNKLPRKYRIISRVRRSDAPENFASPRYVGMHNRFADDSRRVRRSDAPENLVFPRYVDRHNGVADDSRRVCRSDAPENIVSSRDAGMYYGAAGDTKTAETLVLSGFSGGGGLLSKPRAAFAHTVCFYTWETAKAKRAPLRHPAVNPLKTNEHRYVIPQRECTHSTLIVTLRDLKQKNDTS